MKVVINILTMFFLSCSSPKLITDRPEKVYIIEPGKGINQLHIGSKITSAFALIGKNDKLETKILDGMDSAFVIYNYVYINLGLTISSAAIYEPKGENLDNSVIETMYFAASAKATTSNGSAINKSTLEEVLKTFGNPDRQDRYADVTILHYKKKSFHLLLIKPLTQLKGSKFIRRNGYSRHL